MKHFLAALLTCILAATARADWPTYKGDAARAGYTAEALPANLSLTWVNRGPHKPMPAWPVSPRLGFDKAFQPVADASRVYYGSTADCAVRALDADTGREAWRFFTDGPVRFAPALWKDRLFVASDDGHLYCLSAADGKLLWKKRGGPSDKMFLANDRFASRWPARGGPVVHDDVVYFAAGVWPSEGIYVYALEAATDKVVWCNDQSGSIFMAQPHGGANAASGASAQGYLVVNDDQLLVPTGRAVPAVYDRETGKFRYFQLQANGHKGGSATTALGPYFFNAGFTYDAATGKVLDPVGAGEVAAVPDGLIVSTAKEVIGYRWADKEKKEKPKFELVKYKGLEKAWSVPGVQGGAAVLVAGDVVVSGGSKQVALVDRKAQKTAWSAEVDGTVHGLAAAGGRLFVATDEGTLYCFDASGRKPNTIAPGVSDGGYPSEVAVETAVERILKDGKVAEGYCVDLGCGNGALAYELARRSKLHVIGVESDPAKVAEARKRLAAAGLYGARVTVIEADPAKSPLPKGFADLVVSGRSAVEGASADLAKEADRLRRPYGGVALLGKPEEMKASVAGPPEGAGQWTHQYADPGNTCCSADNLVKGQLGMLWFRDSDLDSPSRHGRAPAPLFFEGRLFVEGTDALRCVNAYNGRRLWEFPLPGVLKAYHGEHLMGTAGTHGNMCVSGDGIFVRTGDKCLRIDPATGKKLGEFAAPTAEGKSHPWGYIALDGGVLFGSLANTKHVVKFPYGKSDMSQLFTESVAFFALDPTTGKQKWTYTARHSIRHNAIAVGGGRVFLIDRPAAERDLLTGDKDKEHPPGELVALDANTGKELWRKGQDIYGTLLSLSNEHGVLLMSYQPTRFKLPSELGGRLGAFKAATGERLWDVEAKYGTRPLVNGKTVYAEGGSWDVLTGAAKPFPLKRSYGCGQLTGSATMMFFRSATLGLFDLESPRGVIDYGGLRPGCWINAIPAGGLVLVPDATSGCQCSYLNQAWIALQPVE